MPASLVTLPLRDREMNERHLEVQGMAGRRFPDAARAFVEHPREVFLRLMEARLKREAL